jgi:hypothetical protein
MVRAAGDGRPSGWRVLENGGDALGDAQGETPSGRTLALQRLENEAERSDGAEIGRKSRSDCGFDEEVAVTLPLRRSLSKGCLPMSSGRCRGRP